MPGFTYYGMTKAALDHYTRCLAVEYGAKGVRVNSVKYSFLQVLIGTGFLFLFIISLVALAPLKQTSLMRWVLHQI